MEATIRMTYEIMIDYTGSGMTAEEFRDYIEATVYRAIDIGFGHEADEYDLEIEIDEEED